MGDSNPSAMRPNRGDLPPQLIPGIGQAGATKRQRDASPSDEQLLKRKRAELKYEHSDSSGVLVGKQPRQIAFVSREPDRGDILLNKFEPDSVNWFVPSKAKENKNATMGLTACDRESLEAFRKTMELMAMEAEDSHGCIYFKWNVEFVTTAEHTEQKRALLQLGSRQRADLPNTEPIVPQLAPTETRAVPDLRRPPVNQPKSRIEAASTVTQPKPALLLAKQGQHEPKTPLPQPHLNLPTFRPFFGRVTPAASLSKQLPSQPKPELPKAETTTVTGPKPALPLSESTKSQVVQTSTPKVDINRSTKITDQLISPGRRNPLTIATLEENERRTGRPCAACSSPHHPVAICPCPTSAPFGAIPFCPVHNSRSHSFDECEQTLLRVHLVPDSNNTGSQSAPQNTITDFAYFIHYLIKNRVNRPPILSTKVCWLRLALDNPSAMEIVDPRGYPWTKEFSLSMAKIRYPYEFEEAYRGKVYWSIWDPWRHQNGNLPRDPAVRGKDFEQLRQELSDGRLKSQKI